MPYYKIFYNCSLGIMAFGGSICLLNYCHDFCNFLKEKITNKERYEDFKFAGEMFIGTGIFVGILGFILSWFGY